MAAINPSSSLGPWRITAFFSEAVQGFNPQAAVTNAVVLNSIVNRTTVFGVSDVYTFDIVFNATTGNPLGNVSVSLARGAGVDRAGNPSLVSSTNVTLGEAATSAVVECTLFPCTHRSVCLCHV
jgi:hypothetical protein